MFVNQDLDPRMLVAIHKLTHAELARCALWPELPHRGRTTEPVFDPSQRYPGRELVQTVGQAVAVANGPAVPGCKPSIGCEDPTANGDDRGSQAEDRPNR